MTQFFLQSQAKEKAPPYRATSCITFASRWFLYQSFGYQPLPHAFLKGIQ
jgi:hypothetical protein